MSIAELFGLLVVFWAIAGPLLTYQLGHDRGFLNAWETLRLRGEDTLRRRVKDASTRRYFAIEGMVVGERARKVRKCQN